MVIDPLELQRQVTLAMVLEPLAEKPGCTTRSQDLSPETSLPNFLAAAVNASRYFYQLAKRVRTAGGQPASFEDLFFRALQNSLTNTGSRKFITYGLLELMFPFVVARLTTAGDGIKVCQAIPDILKRSSARDVRYLDQTRSLAWSTSVKAYKKQFPSNIGGSNLFEHYQKNLELAEAIDFQTSVIWIKQLLGGVPLIQQMYHQAAKLINDRIIGLDYLSRIFEDAAPDFPSPGARADYTSIVSFLLLAEDPTRVLTI